MAGTIADTALQIIAATASDAGVQLAVNWLNQRYVELISRARMKQNRRYGTLSSPQPVTNVTISANAGVTAITFSAAPVDPISNAQISVQGWQLRTNITWYFITAHILGSTSATIETPYTDATGTGLSAKIVKRYLPVSDPSARWISSLVHPRRRKRLRNINYETLNSKYPSRPLVGAYPWCWTEAPRFVDSLDISPVLGTSGQKFIEVYPPSSIPETFGYVYWNVPSSFAVTDPLPPELDEWVLREGVLVDVYRYKSEQWAAKGNDVMAAHYAKREAIQMGVWEKAIQQAKVTDDLFKAQVPIEIDMFYDAGEFSGDIITARQSIMSEWDQ